MKQTSVEWLLDQLQAPCRGIPLHIIEQAKQMHKEEIVDAWRNGDNDSMYFPKELDEQAENYYSENYASKESDKKQQKKLITEIMNDDAKDGLYNISTQKEISDEKIKEIAEQEYKRYPNNNYLYGHSQELQLAYKAGVWDGIKWYSEQLKKYENLSETPNS